MLERLSSYIIPAAAALPLAACTPDMDRSAVHIRAQACMDAFQEGNGDSESSFTATADETQDPTLAQLNGKPSGYLQAWYLDSAYGVQYGVDPQELINNGLTGVAYEGTSPWAADPTEVWEVALSSENPNREGWDDVEQGLYSSVNFGDWDWDVSKRVSVSLFTNNCSDIVEDLNGDVASTVDVSKEAVTYKE